MSDTYRPHVPPHIRSITEQTLDALLRVEELLQALVAQGQPAPAKPVVAPDTLIPSDEEKPVARRRK